MAKAVTKYESTNGKVFDTEVEAQIEDASEKLLQQLGNDCYHDMGHDDFRNMLLENLDVYNNLLATIKGLKTIVEARKNKA